MAEYISREAVMSKCDDIWNDADETTQTGVDTINAIDKITDFIEGLPAADVQPVKHGRWELTNNPSFRKCSECGAWWGKEFTTNNYVNYCPRCGADMREPNE